MMLVKMVMETCSKMRRSCSGAGSEAGSAIAHSLKDVINLRNSTTTTATRSTVTTAAIMRTCLFVLLCITASVRAQQNPLHYELLEELDADTYVGDVSVDAKLNSKYNSTELANLRFSFLTQPQLDREYFYIHEINGVIRTTGRIDRDVICPAKPSCILKFDVAVRPVKFFQIIKVTIEIKDINDNPPVFPRRHVLHQMSESAVPGTSFSIPAAADPDSSGFSVKSYRLNSRSNKFDLRVKETADGTTDLRLVLNAELDREEMEYFQCEIVAEDGGSPPKSGTVLIDIEVLDANDNDPVFENSTYEVHVFENTPLYTTIIRVKAKDPDESANGDVVYQFSKHTQQNFGHLFAIDSTTGEIYVYGDLDYEQGDIYLLTVTANDRGPDSLPAHTTVVVRVQDINDNPPTITVNTLTTDGDAHVSENAPPGTFVAHISVADADSGPNGKFSCAVDNGNFQLQKLYQTEYKIVTAHTFDRELHPFFDLTLQCTDKGAHPQTAYAHIRVTVMDENDHTPQFTQYFYTATIIENNRRDDFVIEVTANDKDADQNGQVHYKLADNAKNLVAIEETTGIITANVKFDHEEVHELEFNVIAMDGGATPRSSTATVVLTVMDVNDEKPLFVQDKYAFGAAENQPQQTKVGQVVAVDRDSEPYNRFTYSIVPRDSIQDVFSIDPHNGKIKTKMRLDRESEPVYYLVIVAQSDDDLESSTATVSIYVADKNDNAPQFDFPTPQNKTLFVSFDTPPGHVFTRLKAHDRDTGNNGKINFFIEGGNINDMFAVNLESGAVSVNKGLDRYRNEKFSLRVAARDLGDPKQSSVAELNVHIGGGAAFQHSRGTRISTNNLIIIIIFIVATVILAIITIVVVIIIRRRDRDPPEPGSPKETEKMIPIHAMPPSSTPSHSQYGTNTQNSMPNGGKYVMTTTLNGGNATAQNRKQKTLSLLSNPDDTEPAPSRGRRLMESGTPASETLLSQGGVDEGTDDLPPPPEYWMVQSRLRSPGDEPPPPAPPPAAKHNVQPPPHRPDNHHQHLMAGLGHHDEDDSDSLSSGAVSNSDSGRGPSSDEGPGGASGSQATLERNRQGSKDKPGVVASKPEDNRLLNGPDRFRPQPTPAKTVTFNPQPPIIAHEQRYAPVSQRPVPPPAVGPASGYGVVPQDRGQGSLTRGSRNPMLNNPHQAGISKVPMHPGHPGQPRVGPAVAAGGVRVLPAHGRLPQVNVPTKPQGGYSSSNGEDNGSEAGSDPSQELSKDGYIVYGRSADQGKVRTSNV